ncbi:hypothetical protein [Novipirellula rosea]|uniref:Uncharacterized protein n=1 Tax=Novipirellula rosea TaxID=1031540 RepID=A0ABP8NJB6_9BACT
MSHEPGHEPDAVWTRTIIGIGLGLFGLVVFAMVITGLTLKWLIPSSPPTGTDQVWKLQNRVPGVQSNQAYERERIVAEERAFLKQYAWQDDAHTIARIPIERAIEIQSDPALRSRHATVDNRPQNAGPPLEDSP